MPLYFDAPSRAEFALNHFGEHLTGTVLDVGSGGSARVFRDELGVRYTAVDVSDSRAEPDVVCDFEREPLPFGNGQFDTVLCFDVLEHVDSPYALLGECARVTGHTLIVSLPNNWPGFFWDMLMGRNLSHRSGYGLPVDEPPKGHRHKWFFNWEEGEAFVKANAARHGLQIVAILPVYERGTTGLIRVPPAATALSYPGILGVTPEQVKRRHPGLVVPFLVAKHAIATPLSWIEEVFRRAMWGMGARRYENLFCRQLWAVMQKTPS